MSCSKALVLAGPPSWLCFDADLRLLVNPHIYCGKHNITAELVLSLKKAREEEGDDPSVPQLALLQWTRILLVSINCMA